jgi:8-oxo-dGTP pyrophosphatase MutT (NUDIX family)
MNIIDKDGIKAVKYPNPAVAVIAYTVDPNGVLNEIGLVKEKNPHFDSGYSESIIMGAVEKDDSSLLQRAASELKEEGGIELSDTSKWFYLGEVYMTKMSPDPIHLFAADVSGITPQHPNGDGKEDIYSFSLKPVQQGLEIKDSLLYTAFFKLFMQIYKKDFKPS